MFNTTWKLWAAVIFGLATSAILFRVATYTKVGSLTDLTISISLICWLIASLWPLVVPNLGKARYIFSIVILISFAIGFIYSPDDCGQSDICVSYGCTTNAQQARCAGLGAGKILRWTFQIACPSEDFFDYNRPSSCGG
jgi:hypothetical protein